MCLCGKGISFDYFDALNIWHLKRVRVCMYIFPVKYAQQIRKVSLTSGNEICNMKTVLVKL